MGPVGSSAGFRNRFAALTIRNSTHAISRKFTTAVRNVPIRICVASLPEPIVHTIASKLGLPKIAAISGMMMPSINAFTTAVNARASTNPTATSIRLPFVANSSELPQHDVPPLPDQPTRRWALPAMPAAVVLGRNRVPNANRRLVVPVTR